nr:hypothetical protein [Tanacetum cinerariifolium]
MQRKTNPRKIKREPTFLVVLDALALTPCYYAFIITADVPKVYMHQFWDSAYKHDTFYRFRLDKRKRFKLTLEIFKDIFKICHKVQGQDFDALPTDEEIMSFLRDLGHTGEIRATPPKKAQKFKKPTSPKLTTVLVSTEESIGKSKRVKRPAKKSTKALARGFVIRETLGMPLSKKKEKMNVEKRKRIDLISEVALTKEAQFEEVRKKSIRDFHKTHLSGSGTITKTNLSVAKVESSVTSKGTGDSDEDETQLHNENKSDSKHETNESELGLESNHEENEEDEDDEEQVKDEFVKSPSNNSDDDTKISDKTEGDEDDEMDYTTS